MAGARRKTLALLVATFLAAPVDCQAKASADWSAVQSIRSGQRLRVRVLDSARPIGSRVLKGSVFLSATAEHLSVTLKDGSTASWSKAEVLKVATQRRRLSDRPRPFIHGATAALGWTLFLFYVVGDPTILAYSIGAPVFGAGLKISALFPGYEPVYNSGAPARK